MLRIFVILAVVLAAALYFPKSRAVVTKYAAPVLNPAFRLATKAEMEKISRDVSTYERETLGRMPDANQFTAWLEGRYAGDATQDSWGNGYVLVIRREAYDIVSLGQDGSRGTSDDLIVTRPRR